MDSDSRSATARATRSSAPPAAVVATSWIGLDGYESCARTASIDNCGPRPNSDNATATRLVKREHSRMGSKLRDFRRALILAHISVRSSQRERPTRCAPALRLFGLFPDRLLGT